MVVNACFYSQLAEWHARYCPERRAGATIVLINDGSSSNEERLGAVGDVCLALERYGCNDATLIVAGDNMFESGLGALCDLRRCRAASVLGVHRFASLEEVRKRLGVVTIAEDQRALTFEEKPERPQSTLAATAIYLLRRGPRLCPRPESESTPALRGAECGLPHPRAARARGGSLL